jgi:phosphopentomutase
MGIVTPEPMPTFPHGFPFEVIEEFAHRTGPRRARQQGCLGTEIIEELGEEHQRTGKWIVYTSADSVFQIAAHEETIPLDELYAGLRHRPRDPHRQERGRARDRPPVRRRARQLHAHAEPPRLVAQAAPAELPHARREAGKEVYGVGKIHDIFAGVDIDHSETTKSNIDGITKTEALLREVDEGLIFVNLVETDMLWGHRNDPVNFHRCLQDFDRRIPDLSTPAPAGPLHPHLRPRLRPDDSSTDHSREHACCSPTSRGGMRMAPSTRASSPTSARP